MQTAEETHISRCATRATFSVHLFVCRSHLAGVTKKHKVNFTTELEKVRAFPRHLSNVVFSLADRICGYGKPRSWTWLVRRFTLSSSASWNAFLRLLPRCSQLLTNETNSDVNWKHGPFGESGFRVVHARLSDAPALTAHHLFHQIRSFVW